MPELPADFDLKLMPDWLKEPAGKNPYADYQGGDDDRAGRRSGMDFGGRGRDDRGRGRPGGGQRPGAGARPGGDRNRKDAPGARRPDGKRPDRPSTPGGAAPRQDDRRDRPAGQSGPRRTDGAGPRDRDQQQSPPPQAANVTIEFFPDEGCALSIGRQIKSTHRAYSLFDLSRMFLARPERHRLKITTKSVAQPLYQVGEDGPISTDKAAAERSAFPLTRHKFYVEVTEQREPLKGNFGNVARCRSNGVLLGPTNYHGYQPALRKLYDERFSRRMSFSDFQREIEVVNDPALVEQWKEQARSVTVYRLKPAEAPKISKAPDAPAEKKEELAATEETPVIEAATSNSPVAEATSEAPVEAAVETPEHPVEAAPSEAAAEEPASAEAPAPVAYEGPVFASLAEVEQHFREHYLPGLIRSASSFHISGEASREIADRGIASAVRQAWEQERGFPGQMMHQLRQQFSRAGLHIFKHRKRMQFVSLIRPSPMETGTLSATVAEILEFVKNHQNANRTTLAAAILGTDEAAIDPARKSTLATDLRWLIETGRVIEFSDGRLELPVVPLPPTPPAAKGKPAATPEAAPSDATAPSETVVAADATSGTEAEPALEVAPAVDVTPSSAVVAPIEDVTHSIQVAHPEPAHAPITSPASIVGDPVEISAAEPIHEEEPAVLEPVAVTSTASPEAAP